MANVANCVKYKRTSGGPNDRSIAVIFTIKRRQMTVPTAQNGLSHALRDNIPPLNTSLAPETE